VRKMNLTTLEVTTLAGSGAGGFADGTGTAAQFNSPGGITYDGEFLYIADRLNYKIRKVDPNSGEVTTLAGDGANATVDGVGAAASFETPFSIVSDGKNLYVGMETGYKIRKIDIATGEVTSPAGDGVNASTDGIGSAAQVQVVVGLTLDRYHLYFSDQPSQTIRKMNLESYEVTTIVPAAAALTSPKYLTILNQKIYLADFGNRVIYSISP